jgi:hypothetical protein
MALGPLWHLGEVNKEAFRHSPDLHWRAGQGCDVRIEGRHVLPQHRHGIAFGVNSDEHHVQFVAICTECLEVLAHVEQCCWTYIWAMGEAEEPRAGLAIEIPLRDRSTVGSVS